MNENDNPDDDLKFCISCGAPSIQDKHGFVGLCRTHFKGAHAAQFIKTTDSPGVHHLETEFIRPD